MKVWLVRLADGEDAKFQFGRRLGTLLHVATACILLDHFLIRLAQVCDDVRFTHIDEQVVFEWDRADCFGEDTVANLKIFDEISFSVRIKANLELATGMLLFIFLLASGNDEVIYDLLPTSMVKGCRAIRIFLTRRLMHHGWGPAVCFHLPLSICQLLG